MEGFKTLAKGVKCFKEGGSVYKSRHSEKSEQKSDIKQDKAIVKKAFAMHDKQEHPGEKTNLSKLKKGGRSKKAVGTVKKFEKASGEYGAKKTAADKKNIQQAKLTKPTKLCGGKSVSKMAMGGQPGATEAQQKYYNKNKADAKVKEDKAMYEAIGSRGAAAVKGMEEGRMDPMGTAHKKGGKIKKYAAGGSIDDDVRARAMKWIESGSPENTETAETPVAKKTVKKEVKLYKPDYSNEDLDRMDEEMAAAERKRESTALARRYPEKRSPSKMIRDEAEIAQRPTLETKGLRLMKGYGMKRGGKAKKMMTGGTCS